MVPFQLLLCRAFVAISTEIPHQNIYCLIEFRKKWRKWIVKPISGTRFSRNSDEINPGDQIDLHVYRKSDKQTTQKLVLIADGPFPVMSVDN